MSDKPHDTPNPLLEDERKNPVYRLGQAVAGFMLLVWAGVLALVFFLVFRFWLSLNPNLITKQAINPLKKEANSFLFVSIKKGRLKTLSDGLCLLRDYPRITLRIFGLACIA